MVAISLELGSHFLSEPPGVSAILHLESPTNCVHMIHSEKEFPKMKFCNTKWKHMN